MNKSGLPPTILALFAPRPPIPFIPPIEKKEYPTFEGCSSYLDKFEEPSNKIIFWTPPERKYKMIEKRKHKKEDEKKKNWRT